MRAGNLVVLLVLSGGVALAASMSVQVQKTKVRATPSQLGRAVVTVEYGDMVQAGAEQKGWYPVTTAGGIKGWLHGSVLSEKQISMQAGATDAAVGVSKDEVALAGKGFNEQVEAKLKADGTLDYTWVDRMTTFNVEQEEILAFRSKGHLPGGDQ